MDALFEFLDGITIIIMYKFEFIIPQKCINTQRIFNFHGGNLRFNRGAHSMVRSILNMDNETFLSLYELSDKIDLGCLIGEYKIQLSMKETVSDIDKKTTTRNTKSIIILEFIFRRKNPGTNH